MTSPRKNATRVFTAPNGKRVTRFVTDSGVTGYVDCDVPMEALEGLRKKLEAKIKGHNIEIGNSSDSEHISQFGFGVRKA